VTKTVRVHVPETRRVLATFGTGNEAVAGADMAMAAKVEHVIHNADGTISECRSHGNDPYPAERLILGLRGER